MSVGDALGERAVEQLLLLLLLRPDHRGHTVTHPFQVHVNGVAVYLVKKSLRGLGRSPPLKPGPPHDDVHVLFEGVGVEGLGEHMDVIMGRTRLQ